MLILKSDCLADGSCTNVKEVQKSASNNIYFYINHSLFDPLEQMYEDEVKLFYATTFWHNKRALECLFAGLAEALRGHNVDRGFFGISMGCIGQSINTHLLSNLLGNLHRYLDMNVYYQDEEMRKQSSAYEDCPVVTAQEKPEGSKQVFRLHLFKLHMAADPTAQRDLYNRITRMVELVGLKRFEFNAMVVFVGVSDENFFSVLRRSHETLYRVKVYDKTYIDNQIGKDAAARGIFPRDPTLKAKLGAPAAAAVLLRMLRAFMVKNDSAKCVQTIEDYVMNGGDGGVTKMTLLKACGLEAKPPPENKTPGNVNIEVHVFLYSGRSDCAWF